MAKPVGDIEMFRWDGGCIFIGSSNAIVPVHAHQAIQVCTGPGGPIRLRASEGDPWRSYPLAVIASHQPHEFDATAVPVGFVMLVEPETREGRALTELYLQEGFASVDPSIVAAEVDALLDGFLARRGDAVIVELVRGVLRALTHGIAPAVVSDERILRAIAWINAHLDQHITLEMVAAEVFLSPGRFRHVFVEQTGMGLRPYVLWRRLARIWELSMTGTSISRAAHEAGFADAAHLTRTSKRMIGLSPSLFRVSRTPGARSAEHPAATH